MKFPLLALALFALAALPGCEALSFDDEPDPSWIERELEAPSENVLWQVSLQTLSHFDFPLGGGLAPDRLVASSGWRNTLQPFKDKGFRNRATIEIDPLSATRFNVRVRVERQRNRALANPLDLRYAEWDPQPDDEKEAAILMQHIRSYLDTELPVGAR